MDDLNHDGEIDYRDVAILYNIINNIDDMYGEPSDKSFVGGLGVYEKTAYHGPFVHVDVRGFRARWGIELLPGKGIGRALVADLEERVSARGGLTLWVGTDDEDNMTSLSGVDLYSNVLEHLANIKNLRRHPYAFYQKLGFVIVGVLPDANGVGKPDIFMAKQVGRK